MGTNTGYWFSLQKLAIKHTSESDIVYNAPLNW